MAITGSPNGKNHHPIQKRKGNKVRRSRTQRLGRMGVSTTARRVGHTWKADGTHTVRSDRETEAALGIPQHVELPSVTVDGGRLETRKGGLNQRRYLGPCAIVAKVATAPSMATEIVEKPKPKKKREPRPKLRNLHTVEPAPSAPLDGASEVISNDDWSIISIEKVGSGKMAPYLVIAKNGKYLQRIPIRAARGIRDVKAQLLATYGIAA